MTLLLAVLVFQGGCKRMSAEEEGIRPLPGKSSCRLRKPEQDTYRGAEISEGALLPEGCPHLAHC